MKKLPGLIRIIKPNLNKKLKFHIYEFFSTKVKEKEKEFLEFQEKNNTNDNELQLIYLKVISLI